MNEFKNTDVLEMQRPIMENYKNIRPENGTTVKDARGFVDRIFKKPEGEKHEGYYTTEKERMDQVPKNGGEWTGEPGNSKFKAYDESVNKVLAEYGLDGIEYKNGVPDFSKCAVETVKIDNMTSIREKNFDQFYKICAEKWNAQNKNVKPRDVKEFIKENGLTIHECSDMKTCQLVPTRIHETFRHAGGVMECKKRDGENMGGKLDE